MSVWSRRGAVAVALLFATCGRDTAPTSPARLRPAAAATAGPTVFVGAGNIADCANPNSQATAALLDSVGAGGVVFTVGDNATPAGTAADYQNCYAPTWGRALARTYPVPGNHEYDSSATASGYFGYFGAAAGDSTVGGYYSHDVGAWHIIVLNSNSAHVATAAGSAQETWLKADLAATSQPCVLALWHRPRFYSTVSTSFWPTDAVKPFWNDLYAAGADVIINAHMHDYERFAPQAPDGTADATAGLREFIIGTGGVGLDEPNTNRIANSVVNISGVYGVLKLTLDVGRYAWQFVTTAGTSADSGSAVCHHAGALPPPPLPPPPAGVSAIRSTVVAAPAAITVGSVPSTITVTARDSSGAAISGARVVLSATGSGNLLTQPAAVTGASGVATGALTSTVAETKTVSATINSVTIAQTATVTVAAAPTPPPRVAGSCLAQTGPLITLSGLETSDYENPNLSPGTKIDASTAQFLNKNWFAVRVSGSGACYHGGEIIGQWPPSTPWTFMYTTYGVLVDTGSNVIVEDAVVYNYGNGISFQQQAPNWTVRRVYFPYGRDGCVENDFQLSGTVDDVLMEGCYSPFAAQGGYPVNGSNNVETIQNSVVWAEAMDGVYSGALPGHVGIFEWGATSPQLALFNNVFRADENSSERYLAPPPGKLVGCANNVMIWEGAGAFPEPLPATFNGQQCFTLLTGQAGLDYWNSAVAQWKARHPNLLPDIARPVVSLFSPGVVGSTTLTGVVSLTATAADDHGVASVQLRMNGQNIGPALTRDGPASKYSLVWDSTTLANGTYTLTATATDTAGNTTTSPGVTVTVSN